MKLTPDEKIIQLFNSKTYGDMVLTNKGNIFRISLIFLSNECSDVIAVENEVELIEIKIK